MKMGLRIAQWNLDGAISPSRPGTWDAKCTYTRRAPAVRCSIIPRKDICWVHVQVHVRHESANFLSSAFPTRHRMHSFFPRPQSSVPKRDWFHSPASPCPRKLSLLSVPYSLPVFAQSSIKGDVIWIRQQKAPRLRRFNKEISRWFLLVSRKILLFVPINDNLVITGVEPV